MALAANIGGLQLLDGACDHVGPELHLGIFVDPLYELRYVFRRGAVLLLRCPDHPSQSTRRLLTALYGQLILPLDG